MVTRVACEASGPRAIGGDLNHGPGELSQLERLRSLGFREVQEIALCRWGRPILPTSRGQLNIDQLWLSPELQTLLTDVIICDQTWATHSTVQAVFQMNVSPLRTFAWFKPAPFPWPEDWDCVFPEWTSNLSSSYAAFWNCAETTAVGYLDADPLNRCLGRGQTLETTTQLVNCAPLKLGRHGDLQPGFHGQSKHHTFVFRQLRRINALVRLLRSKSSNPSHRVKTLEVWMAIGNAPGFGSSFSTWWATEFGSTMLVFPEALPSLPEAELIFDLFKPWVDDYERKLKAKRLQFAKDRRKNDVKFVFQDIADDPSGKVDTLVFARELAVEAIDHDDCAIVSPEPVKLLPDVPLTFEGSSFEVVIADHDKVWLTSVDGLRPGVTLRQELVLSSDEAILNAFADVWTPRWNKASHVLLSQWTQIVDFCHASFPRLVWDMPPWQPQDILRVSRRKKRQSAVGLDGVSRADLLSMPANGFSSLAGLFTSIENQSVWPVQLLQGSVSGIDKGKGEGADAYRPVTVFPFLTRVWSTKRAHDLMEIILPALPESIRGAIPNRQAKQIWFEVAQLLEQAYVSSVPIQGILLDIQKCFNSLPRFPIWSILQTLGCPQWFVAAWASFLAGQCRRFAVRNSIGPPIWSNVGFPEGCALSVCAMTLIDWALDNWLQAMTSSPFSLLTYVDDWHLLFRDVHAFQDMWNKLNAFAKAIDVTIDPDKSLVWASHAEPRRMLRQGGNKLSLAARDLGAHHNFCLRKGNRTLTDRLENLSSVWKKLAVCVSPYRYKVVGIRQAAWPRAFYGASVVHIGQMHFVSLRTGATRGLRACRIGANPMLHLSSHGFGLDPEAFCIAATLREVREVGNLDWMKNAWQLHWSDPELVPSNGPCKILLERLSRLGWQLDSTARCHDLLGSFCPFTLAWPDILFRCELAWPQVLAAEVAHRRSFDGLQRANLFMLKQNMSRFSEADQATLRCCLDGTLYCDLGKDKAQRGSGSRCLFCGMVDSPFHRTWICEHFKSGRLAFPWPDLVSRMPACLSCHGWPVLPTPWLDLQKLFVSIPPVFPCLLGSTPDEACVLDVFTDGACACPGSPGLRFASWAVTWACNGVGSWQHQLLGKGHVWGVHQTAYRGELIAMCQAMRFCLQTNSKTRIWCDNNSVVRRTKFLLDGGRIKPNSPHEEVLRAMQQQIWDGNLGATVRVAKVTSHCDTATAASDDEAWVFWHSQQADEYASQVNFARTPEFWKVWGQAVSAIKFHKEVHFEVLKVMLGVSRVKNPTSLTPSVLQGQKNIHKEVHQPTASLSCNVEKILAKLGKKYMPRNVGAVHTWWRQVGAPCLQVAGNLHWVAGMQLFLDFWYTSRYQGLLSPNFKTWFDDTSTLPSDIDKDIVTRTTNFLRVWVAYTKAFNLGIAHKLKRPASGSLICWMMCYKLPWASERLHRLDSAMLSAAGKQVVSPKELIQTQILLLDVTM